MEPRFSQKCNLTGKIESSLSEKKVFFKSLLIFSFFSVFVIVCFLSLFGAKKRHTSPTSSESAKYLVIISVLGEKLGLCWELQFALKDAKI